MTSPSPQPESLRILTRQDTYLQAHLQELLDAQSEGLLAGLGADPQDTTSSVGSRTPTASESGVRNLSKPRSVIPVRQPSPKKIGLRSARRGISKTIRQLSQIKDEEARVLQDEIDQRDGSLSTIESLSSKEQGLREAISGIQAESPTLRIANLKATEKELGNEIHELETRLFEMKAQQRHLLREIQATENGVQSKLSSYKNALQLAEKEARTFLARPPLQDASQKKGVWALPPQRRTLEMAREQFQEEQSGFGRQIEGLMGEKQALDEGVGVWEDVVREVGEVETMLQGEMQDLNSSHAKRAEGGMRRILERMRDAQRHIEELLRVAEEKDWKLLVCCIGAELEALVEGQSVLGEALEASGVTLDKASETHKEDVFIDEPSPSITGMNGRIPDEDDGPGPDLLISQEDV
ncbi:MAG: hypothetical protein OHK93_002212 [Ramalina farinacea]|uniref:Uncharacterized protein n=1 Tax=Ramalina farinacea TaxID=258253 RepID=A0AA43QR38_9LECA|nr:hypothetical protein [Ramalina farinacea]